MATTVYTGGRVLVCDGVTSSSEALVVRDGRVAGVGPRDAMARLAGAGAEHVDVRGATVMPGFVDTHPHVLHWGAFAEPLVDIADVRSHDEIVARVRARAATTPPGEWIMTTPIGEPHYFLRRSWRDLAEGRLPDRHVLDRATAAHPVFIQAWAPVIPNVCAFNGHALARLGIGRETPDQVEHDLFVERIGEHVLGDLIPLRRMLDAGLVVACGTDWGPKNVFEHMALAETHEFAASGRRNDGPAQRVTRAEALRMWTRDAARVLGWEGIGTLAPGSHADLIVVDRDPLECSLAELPGACVLRTVLGGRVVWDAGPL